MVYRIPWNTWYKSTIWQFYDHIILQNNFRFFSDRRSILTKEFWIYWPIAVWHRVQMHGQVDTENCPMYNTKIFKSFLFSSDTDHTCYTMTTAGKNGFLELLPIYLDHVLYPTLTVIIMSNFIFEITNNLNPGQRFHNGSPSHIWRGRRWGCCLLWNARQGKLWRIQNLFGVN